MPIAWNDSLSLNIEVLDEQHKEIVDLINELYDVIKRNASEYVITNIFNELERKLNHNFKKEENLFDRSKWSGGKDHKAQHDRFLDDLKDIKNVFKTKQPALIALVKLDKLFTTSYMDHLRIEDKKYVNWIKEKLVFIS